MRTMAICTKKTENLMTLERRGKKFRSPRNSEKATERKDSEHKDKKEKAGNFIVKSKKRGKENVKEEEWGIAVGEVG